VNAGALLTPEILASNESWLEPRDVGFLEAVAAIQPDFSQCNWAVFAVLGRRGTWIPRENVLEKLEGFTFMLAHGARPKEADVADAFICARKAGPEFLSELLKYVPFPSRDDPAGRIVMQAAVDESDARSVGLLLREGATLDDVKFTEVPIYYSYSRGVLDKKAALMKAALVHWVPVVIRELQGREVGSDEGDFSFLQGAIEQLRPEVLDLLVTALLAFPIRDRVSLERYAADVALRVREDLRRARAAKARAARRAAEVADARV
jgi:hypothetical protein